MSQYFFDSSALVKRYVPEIGTNWIRSTITGSNNILIAQITIVEVVSAVMRRKREGHISNRAAQAIRLLMDRHAKRNYTVIAVTSAVVQRAEDLLTSHPLRAYDSVQLASALEANNRLITANLTPLIFVSADTRILCCRTTLKVQKHYGQNPRVPCDLCRSRRL